MFWNRKDEPFIDERDFNYPKVLIKTPHKDIEGCIKEVTFFYLDDHDEKFMVRSEREDYVTGKKTGALFSTSIKEVEANDWYMKITHDGQTLYETVTKPNLLEIKLRRKTMKLKDYIREGYNIVTTPNLAYKIQEDYPNVLVFTDRALDAIPIGKLLVDRYYSNNPAVLSAKPLQNAYAIERFSCEFTGYETVVPMTGETRRKVMQQIKKRIDESALDDRSNANLLEIKLKDTDSVPEVYYKGQKLEGLIDVSYHYHTTTEVVAGSTNDINMEYLGEVTKYPDIKTIGHKRDM